MAVKHGGNLQEISEHYQIDKDCLLDFSANINPLGIPELIKQTLKNGVSELINYPDIRYQALKQAIAEFHQISPECIFPANGAAEAIYMLGRVLKVKKLLLLAPTFMEYEAAFQQQATEFCYFNLEQRDFSWSVAELIKEAEQQHVTGICLCNPNNPTGQMLNQAELDELLDFCRTKDLVLILDEAFVDFTQTQASLVSSLNDYQHLFIFRSLTKMFAIPGLRLGYLLTSHLAVLEQINALAVPWHINTLADLAGQQALKIPAFVEASQCYVAKERDSLVNQLCQYAELKLFPSQTNFLFFQYTGEGCLQTKMLQKNILIRNCQSFKGLTKKYYRIAVKSKADNLAFLAASKEIICEK